MANHVFLPLFSLQELPLTHIQSGDQREFFSRHYLAHFWSQSWNVFWVPPSPEYKTATGNKGPLLLVTQRQAIHVLESFDIAFPEGVFDKAIENIEWLLGQFPNLTRIKPKHLGNFKNRANIRNQHRLKSNNDRSLAADDRTMRQMCEARWLDARQVYEDIQFILDIEDPNREKDVHWSWSRIKQDRRNMNILSQALTWFGLSLVPPPPFTSMDYLVNYTDWEQGLFAPALTNPTLVSLECNWAEGVLTEVGISTLDTRDLFRLPPGFIGASWKALIQSHLLCVAENTYLTDKGSYNVSLDTFQWGRCQIVEESKIGEAIDKVLDFPDRNMIFLGRGIEHVDKMREAGSVRVRCANPEIGPCPPYLNVVNLFSILCRKNSNWGLKGSLNDIGEQPQQLANMGNCSRWMMHLLIRIIIEAANGRKDTRDNLLDPGNISCDLWGNRLTHPMCRPIVRLPRS